MRKIFSFMMTTLDGYFEGRNHDLGWHNVDEEFGEFAARQLDESGTLVFGRVTYRLMAGFWPTPEGEKADPAVAARMNGTDKIVASRTPDRAEWADTSTGPPLSDAPTRGRSAARAPQPVLGQVGGT
ncbi:dihydrofolate reductase family protein [Streptosporangium sp. NBC_01755]|uniref:dihydrofolate reductase family protein n=1 Tax=unclassified Streptosporangium TaxID=2632669 RepID=UPI002DD974C9|nr:MULTISPECIES: hypothetical protein [unclassified Streptosporangium]WSA24351.1 dihydrofolate reductase family protein [Streptosporangium sp. NBC_01810]WSC97575.1 dihydrofolate reductase family protein [Streptosporangium sp. NBC_01755]